MIAAPPLEAGASQDKRSCPDRFVGTALNERTTEGRVRGMALAMLLDGTNPDGVAGEHTEVVAGPVGQIR